MPTTKPMNRWTSLSVEFANQRNYLDELFRVYPCIPEGLREISDSRWTLVERAFARKDNTALLTHLLGLDLFPIKDSYVAYLRRDPGAIARNPATVNRLCGRLFELGLDEIRERCSEAKETNRQIGPLFRRWIQNGSLGVPLMSPAKFTSTDKNAILNGPDAQLLAFAARHLGYDGVKGLDLVARFNKKYVVAEAKFLTDFGGHQNAQYEDAKALLQNESIQAVKVAVLDGVIYIAADNKMHRYLLTHPQLNIMSALVLREFLYQI